MKLVDKNKETSSCIKNDIEQIRKLFIMPDSPDKFLEFGHELLDLIHNFFKEKGGIHNSISLIDLAKIFSVIDLPDNPNLLKNVLSEIKTKIITHSVKVGNPYYIGHMTSAIPYFMILLEMIIAALNQNQVKIESAKASTFVERELISWMHRLFYQKKPAFYKQFIQNKDVSLGNVSFDGTIANLTAMLVARNKAFPPAENFQGVAEDGIFEAFRYYGYERAVIIVSKRGHYSFEKVARVIGIGANNLIKIPVDKNNKINISELKKVCEDIKKTNESGGPKTKIISIIGIAGTTETGNIDYLNEISKIAKSAGAHYHVDACWGGAVLLADKYKYMFAGIEEADSISIDAHKLLYSPSAMGLVLFRDEKDLNHMKHYSNYIIRQDSVDQGRFTLEGSRPFSALKPWATFKIFGKVGFEQLFEHAFGLMSSLRGLVERHCNFESMNEPEIFIFNYRFAPKEVLSKLNLIMRQIDGSEPTDKAKEKLIARVLEINKALNELNIELHKEIRAEDNSFVSRTTIDSPKYFYQDIVILRAVTVNPLTTSDVLEEIIEQQDRLGKKIYKNMHNKF